MLQKRLIELSKIAYQRDIVTYSDFLNLNELNILHTTPKQEWFSSYVHLKLNPFKRNLLKAYHTVIIWARF